MKKALLPILALLLVGSFLLSGCTGGAISSSWPGVTVDGSTIYVAGGQFVYAVNAETGAMLWKYPQKADAKLSYYAPPVISDGMVVVGDYHSKILALNSQTGALNWEFTTGDKSIGAAIVVDGTIYSPSQDFSLYALDQTGQKKWAFKTGDPLWSSPVYVKNMVLQAGMDHKLYAIKSDSGTEAWSIDLGAAALGTSALDKNGVLYTGTLAKEVLAVNTTNGKILWRYSTPNSIWSGIAEKDGVIYFGDIDGNFFALNSETRQPVWQYKAPAAIVSAPLLTSDSIYFSSVNGMLVTLGYDGKAIESKQITEKLHASPVIAGDKIIVATSDKDKLLVAFNKSGAQAWVFPIPK